MQAVSYYIDAPTAGASNAAATVYAALLGITAGVTSRGCSMMAYVQAVCYTETEPRDQPSLPACSCCFSVTARPEMLDACAQLKLSQQQKQGIAHLQHLLPRCCVSVTAHATMLAVCAGCELLHRWY